MTENNIVSYCIGNANLFAIMNIVDFFRDKAYAIQPSGKPIAIPSCVVHKVSIYGFLGRESISGRPTVFFSDKDIDSETYAMSLLKNGKIGDDPLILVPPKPYTTWLSYWGGLMP